MTAPELLVKADGTGIVQLVLNRPAQLNAWTLSLEAAFFAAVDAAALDPDVRVLVITGAGRGFCAGASMDMLGDSARPTGAVRRRHFCELSWFPKPVIAAVNGAAVGLGFALAMWCDIRICAADAKLSTAFSRLGLVAEHGTAWLLPRIVGRARATDLLLSGRTITGIEAEAMGLVNHAVVPERTLDEALAYAQQLVETGAPTSWSAMKQQIRNADASSLRQAYDDSLNLMAPSLLSADHREGVRAWREKRPPRFSPLIPESGPSI